MGSWTDIPKTLVKESFSEKCLLKLNNWIVEAFKGELSHGLSHGGDVISNDPT